MLPMALERFPPFPGGSKALFEQARITPNLRTLKDDLVGDVRAVLWASMGMIAIVLLIACGNVANLLLVRAESRQQELAIRAALGAGSRQIARELLLESLTLGALGAQTHAVVRMFVVHAVSLATLGVTIGLMVALGVMQLMSSLLFEVSPADPLTYVIVPLMLIGAALAASYLPALRAAAVDAHEALQAE